MTNFLYDNNNVKKRIQSFHRIDEASYIRYLTEKTEISQDSKIRIYNIAKQIVEKIRESKGNNVVNAFMHEYDLSTDEGIALMCLAESLLRIPDEETAAELIKDKIANASWKKHLGQSSSLFVNVSTWALLFGSYILKNDSNDAKWYNVTSNLFKKIGEPIVSKAVKQAMAILGKNFVKGQTIEEALEQVSAEENTLYSFDMLGEAAHTKRDAEAYFNSYLHAIKTIGNSTHCENLLDANGISIKLSALHPRYEFNKLEILITELYPKLLELCKSAKHYNIPLCIDAEEANRLELSLILFEKLCLDPDLGNWDGLGLAVQAYQKRAFSVIDLIEDIALRSQRKIMVRLVKGAYWDYEIKHAQELGYTDYPVFTRKVYTDVSYLECASKILNKPNSIYPCFATHNAYTLASILEIADKNHPGFEFQRLHSMGEDLYNYVMQDLALGKRCRVYAPIGSHKELISYLIRRLLENGANSSFINKINDPNIKIEALIEDPFEKATNLNYEPHPDIPKPLNLFGEDRKNSIGMDINDSLVIEKLLPQIQEFSNNYWQVGSIINGKTIINDDNIESYNPAKLDHIIGKVSYASTEQVNLALESAYNSVSQWSSLSFSERASILEKAADIIENEEYIKMLSLLITEAGKTLSDSIAEVREAIDFLRYYASLARKNFDTWQKLPGPVGEDNFLLFESRGVFLCISPWNFPFAIFIGQIAAALVTGNSVIAKPAEQTSIIAHEVTQILHKAGIPENVLQLLLGLGEEIGKILVPNNKIAGIAFTGSTTTAQIINRMLANRDGAIVPFIAETGGLNAMIVDSSSLLEQVTNDVITSAFKSTGQRCSALRVLFVQDDIADKQIQMICGAMQELKIGDPSLLDTDIGPVIDSQALDMLQKYTRKISKEGDLLYKSTINNKSGYFFPPCAYEIKDLSKFNKEVFGPILHIIRYNRSNLDNILKEINNTGYGLTFAVQSRIQSTIDYVSKKISVGNVYINRNQIGAVVGVQPFGGRGLSGTGPKAGGPHYLNRFLTEKTISVNTTAFGGNATLMSLGD